MKKPPFPNPQSPEQAYRNYEFHMAEHKKWKRWRNFFLVALAIQLVAIAWRYS